MKPSPSPREKGTFSLNGKQIIVVHNLSKIITGNPQWSFANPFIHTHYNIKISNNKPSTETKSCKPFKANHKILRERHKILP